MRKLFILGLALVGAFGQAQVVTDSATTVKVDSAWSIVGKNTLSLNQAAFSNWVSGGDNNIGWIAGVDYNLTYEKGDNLWENIIILGYGQNDTKNLGTRKTQDVINLSTNYGRKISKSWYASVGAGLITQFDKGYEYDSDNNSKKISNFMAPGYVSLGAGFTYRPNDNLTVTLRPANARWTFVLDKDLQLAGNYGLKNDGDSSLFQFGFLALAEYKLKIMENIELLNRASVFSNYLDHPDHMVLTYSGILNMKINRFISTRVTLDLLYDHNQITRTQLKQTLGIGFAYNLEKGKKRSGEKRNQSWK